MHRIITLLSIILLGSYAMAADTIPPSSGAPMSSPENTALFGGGCFWCMEPAYQNTPGVKRTTVGYAGGEAKTATYEQVSHGNTGHVEVIQIIYNPVAVTYEALLQTYFENIDPTDGGGQFADRGNQYEPVIFYANEAQKLAAEKAIEGLKTKFAPQPIAVGIKRAPAFYAAEEHHQKYYLKNKAHYNAYKYGSGRADYIEKVWKK